MKVFTITPDKSLRVFEGSIDGSNVITYVADTPHMVMAVHNDNGLIMVSPSLANPSNLEPFEELLINDPKLIDFMQKGSAFPKPKGTWTINTNGKFFNPLGSGGGTASEVDDVSNGQLDGNLANYTSLEDYLNFTITILGGEHFAWGFQNTTPYTSGDYVRLHAQNVSGDWYVKATDLPETNVFLNFNETDDFFPQCVVEANMEGEANFWLIEWLSDNLHPSTVNAVNFTSSMQGATSNVKGKYYIENGYVRMQVETGYIFPIRISKVSPSFLNIT